MQKDIEKERESEKERKRVLKVAKDDSDPKAETNTWMNISSSLSSEDYL